MLVCVLPYLLKAWSCMQMLISGMPGGKDDGDKKKKASTNGKAKQQASPA